MTERLTARPRRTLLLVLLFVAVAGVLGGPVAGALDDSGGFVAADSGSARAEQRIEAATGRQAGPGVLVLAASTDPDRLGEVRSALAGAPGIATAAPPVMSADGDAAVVAGTLAADADEDAAHDAVTGRFDGQADVTLGGGLIADTQIGERVTADLGRAELLAFPILALLSLLFFRGRAAALPLAVGITTVLGTFLVLRAVNEVYGLSIFALNLVIGLGLGLAIDYSLFMVTRFREELARDPDGAVARTVATAGRTVVFSAVTVAAALITLTLFPQGFIKSMGIAGATVAVVAAAATLVLCPALFALWGRKLQVKPRSRGDGLWYRLSHAVMRRPAVFAIATALVMLAATAPALRAQFTPIDATVIPKGESARTVADTLTRDFGGVASSPVTVVADRPVDTGLPGVTGVEDRGSHLVLTVAGEPEGPQARAVVEALRDDPTVLVGGAAAEFVDQQAAIAERLPLALGLLVALTFIVLWAMTGSVVLPLKAIVMNALTVSAALGVLTLIYQDGRFEDLLGYTANGGVEPTDFLVTAALVFALSTDYGVFLLGRIKEARDAGLGEREAVAVGLERTGKVVTAAAILLAVAIGSFATSSISFIQQIGVATATGVLIDAFVVRGLLVPSLMALLGKWNWWAPMWLRRAHDRIGPLDATPA